MGCSRRKIRISWFVLKQEFGFRKAPVYRGLFFCVLTNMALAYTSSNAVPTSTKAFLGKGPLVQQSMNYGQAGSVAESPSGFNLIEFTRKVPFSTGINVIPTGQYIYSTEDNLKGPFFKMLVVNPGVANKNVIFAGINAIGTGTANMSTGVGIPISGGGSYEFGGLGTSPVRNLWVISSPGQTATAQVYGQYDNLEAL
jgi:hypothetical protein